MRVGVKFGFWDGKLFFLCLCLCSFKGSININIIRNVSDDTRYE